MSKLLKFGIAALLMSILCTNLCGGSSLSVLPCGRIINEKGDCIPCFTCPPGTQPNPKSCVAGKSLSMKDCLKCPSGFYSNQSGISKCKKCTNCKHLNRVVRSRCIRENDAICGYCKRGYYQLPQSDGDNTDECFKCPSGSSDPNCLLVTDHLQITEIELSDEPERSYEEVTPEHLPQEAHKERSKGAFQWTAAVVAVSGVILTLIFISCVFGCVLLGISHYCKRKERSKNNNGANRTTDSRSVQTNRGAVYWSKMDDSVTSTVSPHRYSYHSDAGTNQDGDIPIGEMDTGPVPHIVDIEMFDAGEAPSDGSNRTPSTIPFDEIHQASSSTTTDTASSPSSSRRGDGAEPEDLPNMPRRIPVSDAYSSIDGFGDDQQAN